MLITDKQYHTLWMLDFNLTCRIDINKKEDSIRLIKDFYDHHKLNNVKKNPLKLARQICEAIMNKFDNLTPELLSDASKIINKFLNSVDVRSTHE